MTGLRHDRRDERPNPYEGTERRFDDGTLTPRDRFMRIEVRQDSMQKMLDSIAAQLNRVFGALAIIGVSMPIIVFVLNKLFPS